MSGFDVGQYKCHPSSGSVRGSDKKNRFQLFGCEDQGIGPWLGRLIESIDRVDHQVIRLQ
ncbi:hypothetical protein MJO28_013381 [Puccinia striiformis f. sp. tritici]|uniref:Uncharacterized protein n=1 Tax=Puccinia striiformis f. sp. tritici TaxID=168172 RepID=A0ACC0DYC6_9BASI|nr:hypothetical protein MJO28_013381 [Puccinia striiformis f. sp. tritici]